MRRYFDQDVRDLSKTRFKPNQHLTPRDTLKKRPSNEAIELHDPKKRNVTISRIRGNTKLSGPTFLLRTDFRIDVDEDGQPSLQEMQAFPKENRVLRRPHRKEEDEKLMKGRCCVCDSSGLIMIAPQCKHCIHNCCGFCENLEESIDGDEAGKGLAASFSKVNELPGELHLVLEWLDSIPLTPMERKQLDRLREGFKLLTQHLPEMEDAEKEGAGPGKLAE